ncbi:MAG: hypothetical protein A2163_07760 [Actinobacteria bacterium RBG_13_35_12]|nr:MAG: hypothetical protein A2163_07760 [Actinobacteria bacterium RBG_13_35_12]
MKDKAKEIEEMYKLMDSFLIETEPPRRIEQLNQDRHLFVDQLLTLQNKLLADKLREVRKWVDTESGKTGRREILAYLDIEIKELE